MSSSPGRRAETGPPRFRAPSTCGALFAAALVCFAQSPAPECSAELARFVEVLGELRGGRAESAAALRASAAALCERCERCDAAEVAAFYAALDADALRRGLEREARYLELRAQVIEAGRGDRANDATPWPALRERVVAELLALADETEREPDFVPAARALALAARIEAEALEAASGAGEEERGRLAARAGEHALRADELFARAGQLTPRLEPRWIAARLALAAGDVAAARDGFEQCLGAAERARNDDYREHALRGLVELARAGGDARAEDRLLESIAEFRDPRQSWPLARDWAARLLSEDRADAALEFLERCEPPRDAHALERIEWNLAVGAALIRLGDTGRARAHVEAAAGGPAGEVATLAIASLAIEESRAYEALELFDDESRLARMSRAGEGRARALLGEAWLAQGDPERAVAELERALALAYEREAAAALAPAGLEAIGGSVVGERLGLHAVALLAAAYTDLGRPLDAALAIESAQSRSLRRPSERTLAPQDLAAWAARFELGLVTWVVGADSTVVACVANDATAVSARIPHGRRALSDAVRRLREAVVGGDAARAESVARELRDALFPREIREGLRQRAAHAGPAAPRWLVCAHGPLEALPFELAGLGEIAGRDDLAIACLPGLTAAQPGRTPGTAAWSTWTIAGDPLDANGRPLLPGARSELEALRGVWPHSVSIERAELRAATLLASLGSSPALHIATHVRTDCDPGAIRFGPAGLQCSAGECVGGEELAARAPALSLAVLSACETGGGAFVDAEGMFGLARAFLQGGTRNVLVTRWPVGDSAAAAFSLAFHRALAAGETPAPAALAARRELAAAGVPAADWGAFALLGRD
jgi:hypothetical protein